MILKEGAQYTAGELKLVGMGPQSVQVVEQAWQKQWAGKPYILKDVNMFFAHLPLPVNVTYTMRYIPLTEKHEIETTITFRRR